MTEGIKGDEPTPIIVDLGPSAPIAVPLGGGGEGIPGPPGPQGEKGEKGDTGPRGPEGPEGPQGERGPEGPEGPQGPPGEPGEQGPPGADGKDGVVQSIVAGNNVTVDDSDPANPIISSTGGGGGGEQGPPGDDGLSAYELAVQEGFSGSLEDWLASLVGPEGPEGPEGPRGLQGEPGEPGADGQDGEQGPPGEKGDPGQDGEPGADGLSAYEVAVENGFEGTEQAWLTSLVGPEGPEGPEGPQGPSGDDGEQGPPGADGHSPVITWDDTTIVVDGAPGPDLQGPQGEPGEPGSGSGVESYDEISGLADYPSAFPPDLTNVTPGSIGAQPAGDYATSADLASGLDGKQDVGDYATSADLTSGLEGKVETVAGDVKRIYTAATTPPDGLQPGDLVLSEAPSPQGPASIPGLMTWLDAAATGARDLGTMLPDVSGNGNDVGWWTSSTNPASVSALNGLPAFKFDQASYRRVTQETGHRTLSGVFAFTGGVPSADQTAVWCSGSLAFDIGASRTGRLFLKAEGETVYNLPLTWHGEVAYVSFVVTVDSSIRFYLSGEEVATKASTSEGDRGTLVFSRLSDPFVGVWGEFAEHQEHAASSSEVAELAAYYREKWRI